MRAPAPELLGTYTMPRVRIGATVRCAVRGQVTVCGYTDAPIPWPLGKVGRHKGMIVFRSLERAIRRESNIAVAHWWGVSDQTVWRWRSALDLAGRLTPGTRLQFSSQLAPERS
jgi:hypothetical protein